MDAVGPYIKRSMRQIQFFARSLDARASISHLTARGKCRERVLVMLLRAASVPSPPDAAGGALPYTPRRRLLANMSVISPYLPPLRAAV